MNLKACLQYAPCGFIVLALHFLPPAGGAAGESFEPTKDTYITQEKQGQLGDRSGRNYGVSRQLRSDTQHSGEKGHVLLEFDLSKIPADAKIDGALLVLGKPVGAKVGSYIAVEIRRLLRDDWEEGDQGHDSHDPASGACWVAARFDAEQQAVAWEQPGALGETDSTDQSAVIVRTGVEEKFDVGVEVTGLVNDWQADRSAAFGMLIRTTTETINYLGWASREAEEEGYPQLIVEWSGEVPQ